MNEHSALPADLPVIAPALFVFALLYGGMTCIAGVLGNKQVALGPFAVESGMFAFLILVILGGAVTELYGRRVANRLVLWGFVPLVAAILLSIFVSALPPSPDMEPERLTAIQTVLSGTFRIWLAGPIAYGVSQLLNVTIISFVRERMGGPVWVRAGIAGAISQAVDTVIFITVAFLGVFPILPLLIGQLLAKVTLSLLVVPWLVSAAVAIGTRLDRPGSRRTPA
ncbi:queuosine precursor transporter [Croceicoccus sp. YJ47]|uniref:queuosine precursor transporter n=1 Tax=Croceicoccus sp. YJ47 TaxID=2798724 RepID=UPI0019206C01|nr:queuosine precursor transporter [Croceicoccus sp. YJ47]QQN73385.1 queuosine precursor transporter [Croceicoccus sp. YJ47]